MLSDRLYNVIEDDVLAAWAAGWKRTDVSVFWRSGTVPPRVDPLRAKHFLRNEVNFGRQEPSGFGFGMRANFIIQRGSVQLRCFSSRQQQAETEGLEIIGEAVAAFRNWRAQDADGGDLSFVGGNSGFDWGPTEDGVWFMRGYRVGFEYRFFG